MERTIFWERLLLITFLLFLWELGAGGITEEITLFDPIITSRPSLIIRDLVHIFSTGLIFPDLWATLQAALYGLFFGIVSGMTVGLFFAYSPWLSQLCEPLMAAINAIPRPALAPLLVIWLGFGLASKVILSWSLVFFVIYYNTYQGVKTIDSTIIDAIKVMQATRSQILRIVVVPSVLAWVFAALRTSVAYALIGAIIGEFVGATRGLGYRMIIAEGLLNTDRIYSILVILAVIAVCLNAAAHRIEKKFLTWQPPSTL
jgi:NitT/TauT family transport system permease protein